MGSSSSCSCISVDESFRSLNPNPYNSTHEVISELITVQTSIVLTPSLTDNQTGTDKPGHHRSWEYTITTSLTLPNSTVECNQSDLFNLACDATNFSNDAQFSCCVDVVKKTDISLITSILELPKVSL